MELTRSDICGLVLVAVTVGLLLVHGSDRHEPLRPVGPMVADTVPVEGLVAAGAERSGPVVFLDVGVLYRAGEAPRPDQTVVVLDGRIVAMGPAGTIEPPPSAFFIRGSGADVLVPATRLPSGHEAGFDPGRPLVGGMRTDLALLDGDPGGNTTAPLRPEGLLLAGTWFPMRPVTGRSSGPVGGH